MPSASGPAFIDITAASGLSFAHRSGMAGALHLPEIMGPGAALADFDGDGDLDALLVQGGALDAEGRPVAGSGVPRLFRNDLEKQPDGRQQPRFTDVTLSWDLRAGGYGMGVATGDFDNDGWIDVLLTGYGRDRLLRNDAGRRFIDVSERLGTAEPGWSVSATFFDYDRDGWLDLFVARYVDYEPRPCFLASTRRDYCGPKAFRALPGRLLHNLGGARFEDVTALLLGAHRPAPGLGVVAADLDEDGWLDLYVANDGSENHLWLNRQAGPPSGSAAASRRAEGREFREGGLLAGVALNRFGQPQGSMGVDAGDVDGDGHLDLLVTNLTGESSTLYVALGHGLFEDRSVPSGLALPSLPLTGFGAAFLDYDLDGRLDVVTVNGAVHFSEGRPPSATDPLPLGQRMQLLRNRGGGHFEDATTLAGASFVMEQVGRGLAVGDVDEDGDPDLLVGNANGPARLLLNALAPARPWLGLRLLDGRRDALGALVRLRREGGPDLWRRVHTDGSYASAGDPRVLFGLADAGKPAAIDVRWSDGAVESFPPPPLGRYGTLRRGSGRPVPASAPAGKP